MGLDKLLKRKDLPEDVKKRIKTTFLRQEGIERGDF